MSFAKALLLAALIAPTASAAPGGCLFSGEPADAATIQLRKVVGSFERPVAYVASPDKDATFYVVEQPGTVKLVVRDQVQPQAALAWRDKVDASGNEMGLLGMAFHPTFAQNRRVFFNYTPRGSGIRNRVAEFMVLADGRIDPSSEKTILEYTQAQPFTNHKGGHLAFGPDGFLYIGTGDGGSANDPRGNGQNLRVLLAKMLRIDVDRPSDGNPYGIPADNPRFSDPQARREIYAYGLRNPWRYSFDRVTGELWAADVGQDKYEEIDVITKGANFGWNTMEGLHCFRAANCSQAGLALPVVEYPRSQGASVTGGYVYRGQAIPALVGAYVYADYVSGNIWALRRDGANVTNKLLVAAGLNISSFGEDKQGELYVIDHSNGEVLKIIPGQQRAEDFPRKLSETGCFASLAPLTPAPRVAPYQVSSALWSDGATKERYVFVPRGATIGFDIEAPFVFPTDTVLIKNFSIPQLGGSRRVETRFLVKRPGNRFSGYSYRWNDEQTEAFLLADATTRDVTIAEGGSTADFSYYYPSAGDCVRCHTASAGLALGFDRMHLNLPGQLSSLAQSGVFEARAVPTDVARLGALAAIDDTSRTLNDRARAYLHTQCAHCHNSDNGSNQGDFDLTYGLTLAETGACDKVPKDSLGVAGARVIKPGDAQRSVAWLRAHSLNKDVRMPPLASSREDRAGTSLLASWIGSLRGCN